MTHRWVDVVALDDLSEDRPLGLVVEGVRLAAMRRGDQVSVIDDRCPHMDFPLSDGQLVDGQLRCAMHGWVFDVFEDPAPSIPPELRCRRWPVRVKTGRVQIGLADRD